MLRDIYPSLHYAVLRYFSDDTYWLEGNTRQNMSCEEGRRISLCFGSLCFTDDDG